MTMPNSQRFHLIKIFWSGLNLKIDYFQMLFLQKSDLRISTARKHVEIIRANTLKTSKTTISSTLLIRYWFQGAAMWIEHCHLCMEGHLKLYKPLKNNTFNIFNHSLYFTVNTYTAYLFIWCTNQFYRVVRLAAYKEVRYFKPEAEFK